MNRKSILCVILALAMILPLIPLSIVYAQTCIPTGTGTGDVCFDFSSGAPAPGTPLAFGDPPYIIGQAGLLPHGFFGILIQRIATPTVLVTMTFPSPIPQGTRWTWYNINTRTWSQEGSLLGSNDGDNVITILLTDDGPEDVQAPPLGTIYHIGGPNIPLNTPQDIDQSTGENIAQNLRAPNLHNNIISINPSQTVVNQPVTITTNVINEGSMEGSTRLALKINGQVEQTQLVNVGPGGSRPVKFTVTKATPGTYTVIIGNQRASFLVTEDTTGNTNIDGGAIAIMLIVLLATAVVIVLALSFRRKPSY